MKRYERTLKKLSHGKPMKKLNKTDIGILWEKGLAAVVYGNDEAQSAWITSDGEAYLQDRSEKVRQRLISGVIGYMFGIISALAPTWFPMLLEFISSRF